MERKRKIKGFTLIELLVTIVIMGLLFTIATPQVSNITNKNAKKKYEAYKDSVEYAAKMYADSYANDMFGEQKSGCYELSYTDLEKHNLLRKFQENGVECPPNDMKVQVNKTAAGYEYYSKVECYKNNHLKYEHNNLLPVCENSEDDTPPEIEIETEDNEVWKNTIINPFVINITISDDSGLKSGQSIIYGFKKSGEGVAEWYNYNYGDVDSENNDEISYEIPFAHIPKQSGQYKLIVKPDDRHQYGNGVIDINENELHKNTEESPFLVDVDPPNDPQTTVIVDDNYAPDWGEDEEYVTEFNNGYQTKEEITWGDLIAEDNQSEVEFVERKSSTGNVSCNNIVSPATPYSAEDDFEGFDYTHTEINTKTFCIRSVDIAGNFGNWKKYLFTRISLPPTPTPTPTSSTPQKCKKGKKTYKPGDKLKKVWTTKWSKCKSDADSSKCNTKNGKKERKYQNWTCTKFGWNKSAVKTKYKKCSAKTAVNKCYKIISKKYYVCPSDQNEVYPKGGTCGKKEKTFDRFWVYISKAKKKNKNTHVHIKIKVHSNQDEYTVDNDHKRNICIVKVDSDVDWKDYECVKKLDSFGIKNKWIKNGQTKTMFSDDVDITGLKKGTTYKICLMGKGDGFRFKQHCKGEDKAGHKIQAFTVTKKP